MTTHSSVLAWTIPWTEEPGRLHTYNLVKNKPVSFSDEANFINVSLLTYIPAETGWEAGIWDRLAPGQKSP